jgi:alditol oxidase
MASTTTLERNWSGTYAYAAQQIYRPRTLAELQRVFAGPQTCQFGHRSVAQVRTRHCACSESAEIRTVAPDELRLSPAYERKVFGVHFTWQPEAAAVNALIKTIEAALQPFHPRPHWAKVFGAAHQWSELYPRLADFRRLVEAYDPRGIFRNPYLSRTILG